jgi:hypothetical protein
MMSKCHRLMASIALGLLMPIGSAFSADALLQSALQQAECITPTSIKRLWSKDGLTAYEANCSGTSHRIIAIICSLKSCYVREPQQSDSL